jgi:hypothetical protein
MASAFPGSPCHGATPKPGSLMLLGEFTATKHLGEESDQRGPRVSLVQTLDILAEEQRESVRGVIHNSPDSI